MSISVSSNGGSYTILDMLFNMGSQTIVVNGKTIVSNGQRGGKTAKNFSIVVDGDVIETSSLNEGINIDVKAERIGSVTATSGSISLQGNVNSINSTSGDITIEGNVGNVNSTSGDIKAKTITGMCNTVSGDINVRTEVPINSQR